LRGSMTRRGLCAPTFSSSHRQAPPAFRTSALLLPSKSRKMSGGLLSADPRQHEIGRSVSRAVLVTDTDWPAQTYEHKMSDSTLPQEGTREALPNAIFTDSSPLWPLLSPDEQIAAERTATERVLTILHMARRSLEDCLLDLRLARKISDWRRLAERLTRVKREFVPVQGVRISREDRQNACCARLILLGSSREEASAISSRWIEHLAGLYKAGTWLPRAERSRWYDHPNEDIRSHGNISQEDRAKLEECWVKDGNLLVSASSLWNTSYERLEIQAFGTEPYTNPFYIAAGEKVERFRLAFPPASEKCVTDGFTRAAANFANDHVKGLLKEPRNNNLPDYWILLWGWIS